MDIRNRPLPQNPFRKIHIVAGKALVRPLAGCRLVMAALLLTATAGGALAPATPVAASQQSQKSRAADTIYEKALISFHGGNLDAAAIHLKNALREDSAHLPSRILMAEILIARGDGAGAEVELEFARERGAGSDRLVVLLGHAYVLQGKNDYLLEIIRNGSRDNHIEAEISYLRGRAYFATKKLANAKRSYQQALERNPGLHAATLGLAQVAAVHEQYDRALAYIDQALAAPDPDPGAWILKAKIYKLRGFKDEALKAIDQAMALNADHVLTRLTRAALLIDVRKYDAAEADIDYILAKIPREPRAKYLKAVVDAAQGDFSQSNTSMTEIITILRSVPPEVMRANPAYYYLAGLTNFQFNNIDEARANLQDYLKFERDDIGAMRLLGALELRAGDPMAANAILSTANRSQPNNPTILTLLGMTYLDLGNMDKANQYLERVTKLLPDSPESMTNLARGKMAAGSFDVAIQNLLKAEAHNLDSLDVKLLLAEAYQKSGRFDEAVAILGALKARYPENSRFLTLYATAVGLAGDHAAARENYEAALKLDPGNLQAQIHLARMDVIEGAPEKAVATLTRRLKDSRDNPVLMLELGNIYKALGDPENTLFWYEKAYAMDVTSFAALNSLVDGHILAKDTRAAIAATAEYLNRFPRHSAAYSLLGKLHQRADNPAEAIRNFKLAAEYAVQRGPALLELANAQLDINDHAAARKTLQKAVAWDPGLNDAFIGLIKMAVADKDEIGGFAMIKHLRSISGDANPAPDILSGDLHAALGDYEAAEKSYQTALRVADNPVAVMGLYRIYHETGKMDQAIATLEAWHEKYPEDLRSALALGNAYKRHGLIKKAVAFHEALLEKNPGMPLILNNAAALNYMVGDVDKALDYARRANRALPDNASILDTLAWIETRRGRPENALPLLRQARVLNFSDPEIKYHLAVTLAALDRRGEAEALLAEALMSRTAFPERAEAEQTLKQWRGK